MDFKLERFIEAHEQDYTRALSEIQTGRKLTHWMWYIFPQITGLGMSEIAQYYEIKSLEEARAYFNNDLLREHLLEISNELLKLNTGDPIEVFGDIDALKLKSSMTLFSYISNEDVFNKIIDKYYNGIKDETTLRICSTKEVQNMLKPFQQSAYIILHDKEIMFIVSNLVIASTTYLTNQARYASREHKVLLFVHEESKSVFLGKQRDLENENTNIIYSPDLTVEDMERFISDNKPEYVYIDYFSLINTQKEFDNDNDKYKFILNKIDDYTEKYNVKIMITDRYNSKTDPKNKYLTNTYDKVNCIWILKEDTMTRIK